MNFSCSQKPVEIMVHADTLLIQMKTDRAVANTGFRLDYYVTKISAGNYDILNDQPLISGIPDDAINGIIEGGSNNRPIGGFGGLGGSSATSIGGSSTGGSVISGGIGSLQSGMASPTTTSLYGRIPWAPANVGATLTGNFGSSAGGNTRIASASAAGLRDFTNFLFINTFHSYLELKNILGKLIDLRVYYYFFSIIIL